MAFKGIFKFKNKEYNLLDFDHEMTRGHDIATGAPTRMPTPGIISITVEAGEDNKIAAWAFLDFANEEGEIILYKRDSEATLRKLVFKDAYIVKYHESFNSGNSTPCSISISITPKEIEMSPEGINLIASWNA